jgi:hypothetical protein
MWLRLTQRSTRTKMSFSPGQRKKSGKTNRLVLKWLNPLSPTMFPMPCPIRLGQRNNYWREIRIQLYAVSAFGLALVITLELSGSLNRPHACPHANVRADLPSNHRHYRTWPVCRYGLLSLLRQWRNCGLVARTAARGSGRVSITFYLTRARSAESVAPAVHRSRHNPDAQEGSNSIKINNLLEAAGWHLFPEGSSLANIRLQQASF